MSLFSAVELAPRDPILGLNEAFNADARTTKVNLGVGVYFNEEGKIPLLRAVREAEKARVEAALPRGYLPIEGIAAYDAAVQKLLLGNDSPLIAAGRVVTAQALGGTGALKIGADFLKRVNPAAKVAISDPSWENHRALFESAGFEVVSYPYYDAKTNGVNFEGMLTALNGLSPRQRACVVLRYYEDLPVAQVAAVLGVAEGAVKRYLSEAMARLAARLSPAESRGPGRDQADAS